jgi:8-amino-7-oxononanoate synthase
MRILVTGTDTGIGKTRVTAALARLLGSGGAAVQVVKVVETGIAPGETGDAARAVRGVPGAAAFTLASFPEPLPPAAAAAAAGRPLTLEGLLEATGRLPAAACRIYEGAGGIASPLDGRGRDWTDFAVAAEVEFIVLVVADRLGAVNQGRLAAWRTEPAGARCGLWLNACAPVDPQLAAANREGLRTAGLEIWAEQEFQADLPRDPDAVLAIFRPDEDLAPGRADAGRGLAPGAALAQRWPAALAERDGQQRRRRLRVAAPPAEDLNLADNDYLDLACDPAVAAAAAEEGARRTSSSASPLITGWRPAHARLVERLAAWHGLPAGLLWSSGYAANAGVLGTLPQTGDLVVADRLIHHSMIAGLRRSGARLQRYPHLDLGAVERSLERAGGRPVFVVTESVFSMDGDYPDLRALAELKRRHPFCWILDEAHALGWYGPEGAGLARAAGVEGSVDVLVGTLGKTLASGGAYTLFRDETIRDYLINFAGEFIYSTALPPPNAAAAEAAIGRVCALAQGQEAWHRLSRGFRADLRADGWQVPDGDSPIVPVRLDGEAAALALAQALQEAGIHAAAVRPPTVPSGTSRLRFSLKRSLSAADLGRVRAEMARWRSRV